MTDTTTNNKTSSGTSEKRSTSAAAPNKKKKRYNKGSKNATTSIPSAKSNDQSSVNTKPKSNVDKAKTSTTEPKPRYVQKKEHSEYHPRTTKSMEKFTKECVDLGSRGPPTIRLAARNMSDEDLVEFIAWFKDSPRHGKLIEKKGYARLNLELYENAISDAGIEALVEFLLERQDTLKIKALKLWKNNIGDAGAKHLAKFITECKNSLVELHLSHNRISTQGAILLFNSIEQNSLYPRLLSADIAEVGDNPKQTTGHCPIWLRLEFNFINLEQLKDQYDIEKILNPCYAVDRNKCGPGNCCRSTEDSKDCKVHLYVFHLQYLKPEESTLLTDAKKSIQQIKDHKKQDSSDETSTSETPSVGISTVEDELSSNLPTYIFLDTCAIMNMIDTPEFITNMKGTRFAQSFSFKSLISKAKQKKFGSGLASEAEKVYLILTDTIMQEVDHRKSVESKQWLRDSIRRQLQSEKGYLEQCCSLGFMTMLGAHQGELLLKTSNMKYFSSPTSWVSSANLYNDLKLLEVAAFWSQEIMCKNVIVITADHEVKRRAKKHNIPAELLRNFDSKLSELHEKDPDATWTASVIKSCISKEVFDNSSVPIASRSTSIFEELSSASDIVKKLVSVLQKPDSIDESRREELIHEAEEAVNRWKLIVDSKPKLFKSEPSSANKPPQSTPSDDSVEQ